VRVKPRLSCLLLTLTLSQGARGFYFRNNYPCASGAHVNDENYHHVTCHADEACPVPDTGVSIQTWHEPRPLDSSLRWNDNRCKVLCFYVITHTPQVHM
jgi:hypothetical protein